MTTFRAYLVTPPAGAREWGTVKADADRRARELEGKCEGLELPATKAGLIPFLNELERRHADAWPSLQAPPSPLLESIDETLEAIDAAIGAPAEPLQAPPAPGNVGALVDWIADHAAQRDVELIFEALGVRFGELARGAR